VLLYVGAVIWFDIGPVADTLVDYPWWIFAVALVLSAGNYLLLRFDDAQAAFDALLSAGVVVRDQRAAPQLGDALRISIGSPEENQRVLAALSARRAAA